MTVEERRWRREIVRGAEDHAVDGLVQWLFAWAANTLADGVLHVRGQGAEVVV